MAALPIGEIMMLVGLFLVFFGSGVYIAVVLGALALLSGFIFSDRPFGCFWATIWRSGGDLSRWWRNSVPRA